MNNIPDGFNFKLEKDEEIKQIEKYPDYWISNYGNVFSYKNHPHTRNGWKKLKPTIHSNYKDVRISYKNIHYHIQVHRYVAFYFCKGYSPELVVNHIDGNSLNNNYKNLEWVTPKENMHKGYITSKMDATRNYYIIELYDPKNILLHECRGRKNLIKYIKSNNLDCSGLSLFAYGNSRGYSIKLKNKKGEIVKYG